MLKRTSIIFLLILSNMFIVNVQADSKLKNTIRDSITNFAKDHRIQAIYKLNKGSETLISEAQGFSNLERNQKLSVNDMFPILSITHQMTAASILLLEERGLLSTEDKLSKFLSEENDFWVKNEVPKWLDEVTIHDLLSHSSGIPKYWNQVKLDKDYSQAQMKNALSEFISRSELEFTPGEKYSFSNSNYVLLGRVIETVTKKSIKQFFEEELFPKAGLQNTYFMTNKESLEFFDNDLQEKFPARYYIKYQDGKMKYFKAEDKKTGLPDADAGIVSNSNDLIRWNISLHEGKILSEASYKKLTTPYFKIDDQRARLNSHMGYGIFISRLYSGHKYYHNHVQALGMSLDSGYIPSKKISISVFSNTMLLKIPKGVNVDFREPENQVDMLYLKNALLESI